MTSKFYVLGIDQSTQGTKALLLDDQGHLVDKETLAHKQIINDLGYVEHDLNEIYHNVCQVVKNLVAKNADYKDKISSVGLSVQRETVGAWQKSTGKVLYNAIVWQCARGAYFTNQEQIQQHKEEVKDITGLELSEYFSAPKARWLLDYVPEVKQCAQNQDLCIGNIDSFLVFKLTDGQNFLTEPSNASRTLLLDLKQGHWSESMCNLFGIPQHCLAQIVDSNACFGYTNFGGALAKKVPIHSAIGDSQGSLFGHNCLKAGQIKTTYGTGSSIMMNIGTQALKAATGIVTSCAWQLDGVRSYVFEGNINYSAGIITYLKDDLKIIKSASETAELALQANKEDHCYFVPALSGLGAPYFTAKVNGTIVGMTRLTGQKELVRAALDSIAYQVYDVVDLVQKSYHDNVSLLCADGGATLNQYLMQKQADLLHCPIVIPKDNETSGIGAALIAGIANHDYDMEIMNHRIYAKRYEPQQEAKQTKEQIDRWHRAVQTALYHGA